MRIDAKAAWTEFYRAHAEELADLTGELAAAFNKLEETACRLALVVHYVRWAAGDETITHAGPLDRQSMEAGIRLCQWFKRETARVYAVLKESEQDRERRRLIEWIEVNGRSVTVRDLCRGPRTYRGLPDAAESALNDLVNVGFGTWEFVPSGEEGGRPTRAFRLKPTSSGDETPVEKPDSGGFGSVTNEEPGQGEPPEGTGDVERKF